MSVSLEPVASGKAPQGPVVILGAGISGLGAGWRLSARGIGVSVLECDPEIGGLAKSVREDGFSLDVGPHSFFSEEQDIVETVLRLFKAPLSPAPRHVKFYYQGKYLDYPLTAAGVLTQMGFFSGVRSAASFLKSKFSRRENKPAEGEDETVEQWAISNFGRHLYISFFKPYTEQFWNVPCTELSARSIPTHTRMSFFNTLRLLLHRRVDKLDASLIEREMLPTYYPPAGFGEIPERIGEEIAGGGGSVLTGCRVTGVDRHAPGRLTVRYVRDGEEHAIDCGHVVSTMPLNQFVPMLSPAVPDPVRESAAFLCYRPLVVLGMVTGKQDVLGASYIYVMNRPFNRISEMNKFSPGTSPPGKNILAVEIPCLRDSLVWKASKEQLFEMCIGSLSEDGFLEPGEVEDLILVKSPAAYPIYKKDFAPHLKRVLDHVNGLTDISTLGRCGEFMYMDIDKCLSRAFRFADSLRGGSSPADDLQNINRGCS